MFTIISYDIVEDRRRTKLLKLLKGYGTRVQYSVFECDLTAAQLVTALGEIRNLVDLTTDSIRCYQIDQADVRRIQILGIGRLTTDPLYYLVGGE